ncbi:GNAT family N-acetyltransferase [Chloroflexia bacterium SDU3-3]|nr:GNAT family N-acetyltransferase [Chloroflexia bacterium SDU3-3]
MKFTWAASSETIDWQELSDLYRIAPLGEKRAEDLIIVFGNSRYQCFVFHEGKLVGAGRVLSDGLDCAYIADVAVHPEYQGHGLGKGIVSRLVESAKGHKKIILYAAVGKEPFYKKLGFARMRTAMAIFKNQDQVREWGLIEAD